MAFAFDHNPVLASYGEEKYKIATFNVNGLDDKLFKPTFQWIASDIIFCQEVGQLKQKSKDLKEYRFEYNTNKDQPEGTYRYHVGLLVKQSTFCKINKDDSEDKQLGRLHDRQCTVFLQNNRGLTLVAISWHGRSQPSDKDKKTDLENLQSFAKGMRDKYSANVIIGGDFNIDCDKVILNDEFILKSPKEFKIGVRKEKEGKKRGKKKENIDYFICLPHTNITEPTPKNIEQFIVKELYKLQFHDKSKEDVIQDVKEVDNLKLVCKLLSKATPNQISMLVEVLRKKEDEEEEEEEQEQEEENENVKEEKKMKEEKKVKEEKEQEKKVKEQEEQEKVKEK